jgi:hypothetical protein
VWGLWTMDCGVRRRVHCKVFLNTSSPDRGGWGRGERKLVVARAAGLLPRTNFCAYQFMQNPLSPKDEVYTQRRAHNDAYQFAQNPLSRSSAPAHLSSHTMGGAIIVKGKGSLVAERTRRRRRRARGGVQSGSGSIGVGIGLPFSQFMMYVYAPRSTPRSLRIECPRHAPGPRPR